MRCIWTGHFQIFCFFMIQLQPVFFANLPLGRLFPYKQVKSNFLLLYVLHFTGNNFCCVVPRYMHIFQLFLFSPLTSLALLQKRANDWNKFYLYLLNDCLVFKSLFSLLEAILPLLNFSPHTTHLRIHSCFLHLRT